MNGKIRKIFFLSVFMIIMACVDCGCQKKAETAYTGDLAASKDTSESTADKAAETSVTENTKEKSEGENGMPGYVSITMDEAEEIFKTEGDYIILDVRRPDEFANGHIPGAINVANESISDSQPKQLPDKDQTIYVYCRSGRRSKDASQKLAAMGYTNIIEFGGILDWKGETVK